MQPSPLLRGFEQGADGTDAWNDLAPGGARGPLTLDPQAQALAQQFAAIKAGIGAPQPTTYASGTYNQIVRDAMGLNKPVMSDAYGYNTDTGNEPDRPVFSDKELPQYINWNKQDLAARLFKITPDEAHANALTAARNAYQLSFDDPNLPENRRNARMEIERKQGLTDVDVIEKAMQDRARMGRRY
jgi:hypothetical protein